MDGITDKVNQLLQEVFGKNMRGDLKFKSLPANANDNVASGNKPGIVARETKPGHSKTPAIGYFIQKGPKSLDFYLVDSGFGGVNRVNMKAFVHLCRKQNLEVAIIDRSGPAEVDVLIGQDGYPLVDRERYGQIMDL